MTSAAAVPAAAPPPRSSPRPPVIPAKPDIHSLSPEWNGHRPSPLPFFRPRQSRRTLTITNAIGASLVGALAPRRNPAPSLEGGGLGVGPLLPLPLGEGRGEGNTSHPRPIMPTPAGIHPLSTWWRGGRGVRSASPAVPRRKTYPCQEGPGVSPAPPPLALTRPAIGCILLLRSYCKPFSIAKAVEPFREGKCLCQLFSLTPRRCSAWP